MLYIRYGTAGDGDDREDMIEGASLPAPSPR